MDDENNDLKVSKKKVSEKTIPPNVDVIKLVYQYYFNHQSNYNELTDEELEREKNRLLNMLKEEESGSRKSSRKTKV